MEISRAWAHDSNDVSHLTISHLKVLKKFSVGGWCGRVIIVSALSLSFRDKEREREKREIELDNFLNIQFYQIKANIMIKSL